MLVEISVLFQKDINATWELQYCYCAIFLFYLGYFYFKLQCFVNNFPLLFYFWEVIFFARYIELKFCLIGKLRTNGMELGNISFLSFVCFFHAPSINLNLDKSKGAYMNQCNVHPEINLTEF